MKVLRDGVYAGFLESLDNCCSARDNCLYVAFRARLVEYGKRIDDYGKALDALQRRLGYSYETFLEFSIDLYSSCGMVRNATRASVDELFSILEDLYNVLNDMPLCVVSSAVELTAVTVTEKGSDSRRKYDESRVVYENMRRLLECISGCLWQVHIAIDSIISPEMTYRYRMSRN